jgi:ClpP class serine protease
LLSNSTNKAKHEARHHDDVHVVVTSKMKSTARTSRSLCGPPGPPLLHIASLFTIMMALLLCVVNAKNNNCHAHLLAGHRRGFHPLLFASTKKKQHPLLFDNNNDIIPSLLFGVRGGGADDDFVEENPEYEPPEDDQIDNSDDSEVGEIEGDESSDEERIDDDNEDQEEEKEDLVSISNSKQSKPTHTSSSTMSKSKSSKQSSINKRLFNLWKSNQFNIYILLAVIAFRNDIYQLCIQYNVIPTQIINPITGERKIVVRWTTDVLKLILVAEIVRRCFLPSRQPVVIVATTTEDDDESDGTAAIEKRNQTQTHDVDDEDIMPTTKQQPSPAVPLLLLLMILIIPTLLRRNITSGYAPLLLPIVTSFIFRSMRGGGVDSNLMQWILPALGDGDLVTRMAYMPPLEQHYAFEQLNERYYRDWGAWRKAFPTNPALQSHHHHYYYLGRKNQTSEIGGSGSGGGGSSASSGMMALIDAITSRKSSSSSVQQQQYSSGSKSKVSSLSNKYPNVYNNGTAIILDMTKLDTQASSMETTRDQISFLVHLVQSEDDEFFRSNKQSAGGEVVQQANDNVSPPPPPPPSPPELEVIVLLESPGGSVSSYGLAASHLQRLRSTRGIKLTICVDTVAASGGYMMACMASPGHLLCAPFAMVGSIGVIGQSVNVQKALEKFGVRPYVFTGGRNKNPVGMLGDVTKDGMETMQHMIDRIHESFREHVREAREDSLVKAFVAEGGADKPPSNYFQLGNSQTKLSHSQQSLDRVANGDVFLGVQALKLGLVDRLITSDEYIAERIQHGTRVLKLVIHRRPVGLSSLLIGPPHHSFAWNKWIVRAKNVASMIASSWSDFDASHVNSVQLKMENTRL